jgi:DNA polymerase V
MTKPALTILRPDVATALSRPLLLSRVPAGFPSPADDYLEGTLDLNQHLIRHKAATFFVRVQGDSMTGAGIQDGDLLIVDRAVEPRDKSVAIAVVNGEFTVKRIRKQQGRVWLAAENADYPPLEVTEGSQLEVWGVVTHVIHALA